jgi:precorrin-6A/cobalt-precorrin-6A reductase
MTGVLIIGGAAEARALARAWPGARVHLPVPERVTQAWPGPVTIDALRPELFAGATAVVEAAHPCNAATAFAVAAQCRALGLPCLQLVRPGWRAGRRDRWHRLRSARAARAVIPRGARVLVSAGWPVLADLRGLHAHVFPRRIAPFEGAPVLPLRVGHILPAEGPFSEAEEIRTLRRHRIDWLLVHDAGGAGGWPKLAAARRLGLPVAMIDRPRRPDGPRVSRVTQALDWLRRQEACHGG